MPINLEKYRLKEQPTGLLKQPSEDIIRKEKEADEFLEKPWYKQLFSKQVREELPQATADVLVGQPAKFLTSTAEIPETLIKGKATQREYKIPGLTTFKSFQSEAEERANDIIEGDKPLYFALAPFAEVPLAGMEAGFAAKGIQKGVGAVSQLLKAGTAKRLLKDAIEITSKALSKKVSTQALTKSGKPGGAVQKGIFSKKYKVEPTEFDIEVADSVKDIVGKNKSPIKNITNINKKIEDISENEIRPFLQKNPSVFNIAELESRLNKIEPPLIIKSDSTLLNTYNLVRGRIMQVIRENKNTMEALWDSRKQIDNVFDKEFRGIFDPDKQSTTKAAYQSMRKEINEFIADNVPNGDVQFSAKLKRLFNMYKASGNIADKYFSQIGTNAMQRFWKNHPTLKKLYWFTAITAAGSFIGSKLINRN